MAAATPNATTNAAADNATRMAEEATKRFEANTERMKKFNSAVVETSKAGSRVVVDNYEKAAKSFFEMQRQVAGASQNQWAKDAAQTQIQFAEEVADAWVKAARELLK
jgi:hypothetical protein